MRSNGLAILERWGYMPESKSSQSLLIPTSRSLPNSKNPSQRSVLLPEVHEEPKNEEKNDPVEKPELDSLDGLMS